MVVFFTVLNHTFPPYLPFQVTEGKTIVPVEVFYILGCLSKLLECGFANKCHIKFR
jgi:glycerol-3-phosphate acyltransferase PlsY